MITRTLENRRIRKSVLAGYGVVSVGSAASQTGVLDAKAGFDLAAVECR